MSPQFAIPCGMPFDKVLPVLQKKGVTAAHHANTVRTSVAFLKAGGLLSRQEGEMVGQTSQYTDEKDKEFGLWDKVFIDTLNIHTRLKRRNLYGPVCFVFDLRVLKDAAVEAIRVSVKNPANWKDTDKTEERWFADANDLSTRFEQGSGFYNSVILTCRRGLLPFYPYLTKIILDDPRQKMPGTDIDTFALVKTHLMASLGQGKVPIEWHPCSYWCECPGAYRAMVKAFPNEFKRLFHP
jgi:hypothetical protein